MSLTPRVAKLGALMLACVAHGGLGLALAGHDPVEMEAGAGAAEVRLGTSFADLAAGRAAASKTAGISEPVTPETAQKAPKPVAPAPAAAAEPAKAAEVEAGADGPEAVPAEAAPQSPQLTETVRQSPEGIAVAASKAVQTARALSPGSAKPVAKTPAASTARAARAAPAAASKRLEAEQDDTATRSSLRPRRRSAEFEQRNAPTPASGARRAAENDPPRRSSTQASRGNAETNALAGAANGTRAAKAQTNGSSGAVDAPGNAARSNYPGVVMRQLSRIPRPSVSARGSATIAFSIAGNGGLSGVSLASSSGSAQLDRAALQLVRRAAPFPAPPNGAQHSFSVQIKGR